MKKINLLLSILISTSLIGQVNITIDKKDLSTHFDDIIILSDSVSYLQFRVISYKEDASKETYIITPDEKIKYTLFIWYDTRKQPLLIPYKE